eukprot:3386451-Amphidinium_carterae.1
MPRHTNGSLLPPEEFCVKESKGSGLGMDFEMVGEMVVVEQVLKGPVSTWSSTNPGGKSDVRVPTSAWCGLWMSGFEVRPADRVVEAITCAGASITKTLRFVALGQVNGGSSSGTDMMDSLNVGVSSKLEELCNAGSRT